MRGLFIFLKPTRADSIRRILLTCRLVISKNHLRPDVNRWILLARRHGIPTLLLVDGPLEWANVHSNPSLEQPGAEAAKSLFNPIIHDVVASIGPAQSRWIAEQNEGRGLVHIEYANRRIQTRLPPDQDIEFDFLLTTAKTAAFSEEEYADLGAALEACARALRPYAARVLVRLFDPGLARRVRAVLPEASFETQGAFKTALARTACVIGTPSSVILEAMHHKKCTALLQFRPHPHFYEAGWKIDPTQEIGPILSEMLAGNQAGLRRQEATLEQNQSARDFYIDGLRGPELEQLTSPRRLDEADRAFEHRVLAWDEKDSARFGTRLRRLIPGLR
jgi:hypothetical protein